MDGRLHVYRRPNSRFWQCSTFLLGRNLRVTTKEETATLAKQFAVAWYMEAFTAAQRRRRGEVVEPSIIAPPDPFDRRRRPVASGPTFEQAAKAFLVEYPISVEGERNEKYVAQKEEVVRVHLMPFFGKKALSEITAGLIQEFRVHRQTSRRGKDGEIRRPSRSTLHKDIVTLRQILKTANRKGWIAALPDMSAPYKSSGKVVHRAWFSPDEYRQLY